MPQDPHLADVTFNTGERPFPFDAWRAAGVGLAIIFEDVQPDSRSPRLRENQTDGSHLNSLLG